MAWGSGTHILQPKYLKTGGVYDNHEMCVALWRATSPPRPTLATDPLAHPRHAPVPTTKRDPEREGLVLDATEATGDWWWWRREGEAGLCRYMVTPGFGTAQSGPHLMMELMSALGTSSGNKPALKPLFERERVSGPPVPHHDGRLRHQPRPEAGCAALFTADCENSRGAKIRADLSGP